MTMNPNITEGTQLFPIIANGAYTALRAMVASTPSAANEERGAQAAAVGQNSTFGSVPRFLGVGQDNIADGDMGAIQRHGRVRVIGGGAITAPAYVTFDAAGKFVSYSHDATKFGMVCGLAATDCSGDGAYFDLVLDPMMIGPASAASDNFTLSGTLTAEQVTSTDDMTVTDDLAVGGDAAITGNETVGGTLGVTGATTLSSTLAVTGAITASAAVKGKQGADVASANDMVLPADGNVFEVTGTTQINHIASTNWQNGAEVTLMFTSNPTVKASQATSGANLLIMLAGGSDFVASANDLLTLVLGEIGGTQVWREKCRSVNA